MKEKKAFEYDELYAMCIMCCAYTAIVVVKEDFKDENDGRKKIEKLIKEIIDARWNKPECD